jgi:hypothetical protein
MPVALGGGGHGGVRGGGGALQRAVALGRLPAMFAGVVSKGLAPHKSVRKHCVIKYNGAYPYG